MNERDQRNFLKPSHDGIWKPNAIIQSPKAKRCIKVNATPEALEVWRNYGWVCRWLKDGE